MQIMISLGGQQDPQVRFTDLMDMGEMEVAISRFLKMFSMRQRNPYNARCSGRGDSRVFDRDQEDGP